MSEPALELVLESVPVEELARGDEIRVHERVGLRPVIRVDHFATLGTERVDCYVVVYEPAGPGLAWENRSRAHGGSPFERTEASLAIKRKGELVQRAPR